MQLQSIILVEQRKGTSKRKLIAIIVYIKNQSNLNHLMLHLKILEKQEQAIQKIHIYMYIYIYIYIYIHIYGYMQSAKEYMLGYNRDNRNACTHVLIVALFTIAKFWNQPTSPSMDE
jgi:hypothetical protein